MKIEIAAVEIPMSGMTVPSSLTFSTGKGKISRSNRLRIVDALSLLKDLESDGSLSQDEKRRGEKKIQALTDDMVKGIENIANQKEKEVLQV